MSENRWGVTLEIFMGESVPVFLLYALNAIRRIMHGLTWRTTVHGVERSWMGELDCLLIIGVGLSATMNMTRK